MAHHINMTGRDSIRAIFHSQFTKTELCKFNAMGKCRNGAECSFAHSMEELQEAPDLTKTSLCKAWQQGHCRLSAEDCPFAHGAHDVKVTPVFKRLGFARNPRKQPKSGTDDYSDRASSGMKNRRIRNGGKTSLQEAKMAVEGDSSNESGLSTVGLAPQGHVSLKLHDVLPESSTTQTTTDHVKAMWQTHSYGVAAPPLTQVMANASCLPVDVMPYAVMGLIERGVVTREDVTGFLQNTSPDYYED